MTRPDPSAQEFSDLFRGVYLTFHRRDRPRSQLSGASRAVLEHLALAGPLTVGEAATHLERAQSVVSDMVTHLERDGLLERVPDSADRRRTLVWLTDQGHDVLRRERDVLDVQGVARALSALYADDTARLLDTLRNLILRADNQPTSQPANQQRRIMTTNPALATKNSNAKRSTTWRRCPPGRRILGSRLADVLATGC